jgi:hypothetical protein
MTGEYLRVQASEEWTALLENVLMTGVCLSQLARGSRILEQCKVQNYLQRAMAMLRESGILPGVSALTRVIPLEPVEKD